MKNLNEKFTDEEYARITRIKELLKMTWHDFIMNVVDMSEDVVRRQMSATGYTEEEIEAVLNGSK